MTDSSIINKMPINEGSNLLDPNVIKTNKGCRIGHRHGQILMYTMLLFLSHSLKVSMTVCVVAMTDPTASENEKIPTYNWTNKGVILSAFFWGMVLPAVAAGWLATTFGPKWFLLGSMIINVFAGCLIPTVAAFGSIWVIIFRVIQGICNGFILPSLYALYGKWIPPFERSRSVGFVCAGGIAGIITSTLMSGYVASSKFGWPAVFYIYGGIGVIWCILFYYFGENSPSDHPKISMEEKYYIETSLSTHQAKNGLISSLPHLLSWLLIYTLGYISDKLISTKTLSVGATRKSVTTAGIIFPAISLMLLAFCGPEDSLKAIIFLVVGIGVETGVAMSALYINTIDLSPNHAGTLSGICNQFSKLSSALGPLAVQFILTDDEDLNQWRIIFFLATGVKIVSGTIFVVFGSGEVQLWNNEINLEESNDLSTMDMEKKPTKTETNGVRKTSNFGILVNSVVV